MIDVLPGDDAAELFRTPAPPPVNRPTREESRRRVREIGQLLADGRTEAFIVAFYRQTEHWTKKTILKYVRLARAQMRAESTRDPVDQRAQSLAFYLKMMQNDNVPPKDRIKARELADKLLGIQAPTKVAATKADGSDVPENAAVQGLNNAELEALVKAGKALRSQLAGGPAAGGSGRN